MIDIKALRKIAKDAKWPKDAFSAAGGVFVPCSGRQAADEWCETAIGSPYKRRYALCALACAALPLADELEAARAQAKRAEDERDLFLDAEYWYSAELEE